MRCRSFRVLGLSSGGCRVKSVGFREEGPGSRVQVSECGV